MSEVSVHSQGCMLKLIQSPDLLALKKFAQALGRCFEKQEQAGQNPKSEGIAALARTEAAHGRFLPKLRLRQKIVTVPIQS